MVWNRPLLAAAVLVTVTACADPGPDQSHLAADRRVATQYGAALRVDLEAMEARPSGLYIQDLVVGEGIRADSGDVAKVHYAGWLPSGVEFDARREGPPLEVALGYGRVIAGWDQGVVGMREGGRRRLVVPPGLAYGEEGRGRIPRNSTLVFEVELLEVEDRTPPGAGSPQAPAGGDASSPAGSGDVSGPGDAAPAGDGNDPTRAVLAVDGEGLRLINSMTGSARPLPFGMDSDEVVRILEVVLAAPPRERGENGECGGSFATWERGPSVRFSNDRFVGWSLGEPGFTTMGGVGIGSTRSELESVYAIEVSRTTLGVEFSAGDLAGVLGGEGAQDRISALWAGEVCLAR